MNPPLALRPVAEAEIQEARAWYENQRPGLGLEFLDAVEATLEKVEQTPGRYPMIEEMCGGL